MSSLSITLDQLVSKTSLRFDPDLERDSLMLNGELAPKKLARVREALDMMRQLAGLDTPCQVITENNFPTAAGLASSASGFAALVMACDRALGLGLDRRRLSMLARAMSGSAARSLFGGFAKILLRQDSDLSAPFGRSYAEPVAAVEHWPLEVCIGIVSEQEKPIGSTAGMALSRQTSPYYSAWIEHNDADVAEAEKAVAEKDFAKLAELSEFSCLKMHAVAMASQPGLLYWHGVTLDAMHVIRHLRSSGTGVFFTVDAGPQIKAVCLPGHSEVVAQAISDLPGIQRVIRCGLGEGAWCDDMPRDDMKGQNLVG